MEKTQEQFNDEIFAKIEEIYNRKDENGKPTGRGFITHLIRAYTPIDKITKVWDSPKKDLKCVITGFDVCTIEDAFAALHSEGMDKKLIEHLQATMKGEPAVSPMKEQLKGKVLAYTGKDTTTVMCLDAVQVFIAWIQNKTLQGDKHMNWLIHDMRRKNTIQAIREKLPNPEDQKKINRVEQFTKKPKGATMSLGDLTILQELQTKLKAQESDKQNN
jgi:hypothetical protein